MTEDNVSRIVREACQAWPAYEAHSLEVGLRILRAYHFFDRELVRGLAEFAVSPGEFGVLVELRLAGPPHRLTPTHLYNRLLVTSGGVTGRIDRLEKLGLVSQLPDPEIGARCLWISLIAVSRLTREPRIPTMAYERAHIGGTGLSCRSAEEAVA